MLIDWFTVGAQSINFLILVWLLKRFLYKPILAAMEAREQQVDANLQEAQQKKIEAEAASANYHLLVADFDRQKADDLKKVAEEAEGMRHQLTDAARLEIGQLRAQWEATLRNEQESFRNDLSRRIQQEVFAIARLILKELAGETLEARMAEIWAERLKELAPDEKERLAASLQHARGPGVIRSAFALPTAVREQLAQAVRQELGVEARLTFETSPDLMGGIELNTEDRKISWTLAASLSALEKHVAELLESDGNSNKEDTVHGDKAERPLLPVG